LNWPTRIEAHQGGRHRGGGGAVDDGRLPVRLDEAQESAGAAMEGKGDVPRKRRVRQDTHFDT
jgi:hypothetical protein